MLLSKHFWSVSPWHLDSAGISSVMVSIQCVLKSATVLHPLWSNSPLLSVTSSSYTRWRTLIHNYHPFFLITSTRLRFEPFHYMYWPSRMYSTGNRTLLSECTRLLFAVQYFKDSQAKAVWFCSLLWQYNKSSPGGRKHTDGWKKIKNDKLRML